MTSGGMKLIKYIGALAVFAFAALAAWSLDSSGEDVRINSRWTQRLIVTSPGSRSEGMTSMLLYKKEVIPPVFDRMIIEGIRFEFISGEAPWDFKGYDRTAEKVHFGSVTDEIDPVDLDRGWYAGSPDARKEATPGSWIWAGRGDLELYLDPDRIESVARAYTLQGLSYDGALMIQ